MQQQNQEFEQEINLREYIDVIIKRKNLILAVFLVSVIITAAISYIMPKICEVSMVVEPPSAIGTTESESVMFLDLPDNMKGKIESGAFDMNIVNALKLDPQRNEIKLKIFHPAETTLLKISINEPENKKDLGVSILKQLLSELTNFYSNIIEGRKAGIDKEISLIYNRIKRKEDEIKLSEENLKISENRERNLVDELKETKANTEQLMAKRNAIFENKNQDEALSSLLYSNTIQQNISYFNQLNNQSAEVRIAKEGLVDRTKSLRNEINSFNVGIEKLKAIKESIYNVKLIQEPRVSLKPIGPSRRKNVVLAGILSLILGTFLAFFVEFWQKDKKV